MLNKSQFSQINNALLKLGFSDKESSVYLAALEQGKSTVLTLARLTGLSRGTVFDVVEKLKVLGFVNEAKQGKKRKIIAESPTGKFYDWLEERHNKLQTDQKIIDTALPALKELEAISEFKPQVIIYRGEAGFHQVWDDIFRSKEKSFLSIARIETFIKFGGEEYLQIIQDKKKRLGFISRAINEDSVWGRKMIATDARYNRMTILAPKEFEFPSTEIIYGDKIAMFSTREENIILVIESKDFAQTHRAYFEMLWKFLEKQK